MKQCKKCLEYKELDQYHKKAMGRGGLNSWCIPCVKIRGEIDRVRFVDRDKATKAIYRAANKEKTKIQGHIYETNRYKNDLNYRIRKVIRARIRSALARKQKSGSAISDLGCTVEEFKSYISLKFQPGMTWENWSYNGWHLDHIIPLSSFDLTNREQFLKACHYTNMQPLWKEDNMKKMNKI